MKSRDVKIPFKSGISGLTLSAIVACAFLTACGGNGSSASPTSVEITSAPTTTEKPSVWACNSVQPSFEEFRRVADDFASKAATRYEVINAMKIAADELREFSSSLPSAEKLIFQNAALFVNQLRVSYVASKNVSSSVLSDGKESMRVFQQVCPEIRAS